MRALMDREGLLLIGAGCLPFAAGAVVPPEGAGFLPPARSGR